MSRDTSPKPDLSDVLADLLTQYGLKYNDAYDTESGRKVKKNAKMKTWNRKWIEVFVYDDNTVGLRHDQSEVEKDLNMVDPASISKLENWLKHKVALLNKEDI